MTAVRPSLPPLVQPHPPAKPAVDGRAAARAFFELAAGKPAAAVAPPQAIPVVAETRAAAPLPRVLQAPAEAPARPLRPGSLLDIRV